MGLFFVFTCFLVYTLEGKKERREKQETNRGWGREANCRLARQACFFFAVDGDVLLLMCVVLRMGCCVNCSLYYLEAKKLLLTYRSIFIAGRGLIFDGEGGAGGYREAGKD